MTKPKLTKAELRAQLESALANYHGSVTRCPPGTPPKEDREQREQALRHNSKHENRFVLRGAE
jgi:hypothetical protein